MPEASQRNSRMGSTALDYDQLIHLARDKSTEGRATLVEAIEELYEGAGHMLTAQNRALIGDILKRLIHDVEVSVRRALSEFLAEKPDAPEDLIVALANDEIDVAYPVLAKSRVLKDPELIEIIAYRTMEHQLAIAIRPKVSKRVSNALAATGNEEVIKTLLENEKALISEGTMANLAEPSVLSETFQQPLVERRDLPPHLARKLYWGVSAALREHLIARFDIEPTEIDADIERVIHDLVSPPETAGTADGFENLPADRRKSVNVHSIVYLLNRGDAAQFIHVFASLVKLRLTLVRRILFEPGGEGLAIVCKAIGLEPSEFATIFIKFRQGRLGDQAVEADELRRVLQFYDGLDQTKAESVLAHMQRDPDYLNALRLVQQASA